MTQDADHGPCALLNVFIGHHTRGKSSRNRNIGQREEEDISQTIRSMDMSIQCNYPSYQEQSGSPFYTCGYGHMYGQLPHESDTSSSKHHMNMAAAALLMCHTLHTLIPC